MVSAWGFKLSLFVILSLFSNVLFFFYVVEVHCTRAQHRSLFGNAGNRESVSTSVLLVKYTRTRIWISLCVGTASMGLPSMNASYPEEPKKIKRKWIRTIVSSSKAHFWARRRTLTLQSDVVVPGIFLDRVDVSFIQVHCAETETGKCHNFWHQIFLIPHAHLLQHDDFDTQHMFLILP